MIPLYLLVYTFVASSYSPCLEVSWLLRVPENGNYVKESLHLQVNKSSAGLCVCVCVCVCVCSPPVLPHSLAHAVDDGISQLPRLIQQTTKSHGAHTALQRLVSLFTNP